MSSLPPVAVLVLNRNGRHHLGTCLPSLAAQVYPNVEVVVVDNGSSDGSVELVRQEHPAVRLMELGHNAGFSAAYNHAVRQVDTPWIVLLNNDTRVEPDWLSELVAAAERDSADVVASRMLTWDGARIDFGGGTTSFDGHSWQTGQGMPADSVTADRELLFACGGSMLVARDVYLDAGGLDEDFFAYFEDVDFGWRASLFGHRVTLAARAVTHHRLHGTSGSIAAAQRLRLYERNALATIVKNYEDDTLRRAFPAAVALSLYRAIGRTGLSSELCRPGGTTTPRVVGLTAGAAAHLMALEDLGRWLPELLDKRLSIQRRRRRSDAELAPLFGDPFRLHEIDDAYVETALALIHDFGLAAVFPGARLPVSRVTSHAPDHTMAASVSGAAPHVIAAGDESLRISVVIPTLVPDVHLPTCLDALAAQDYPRDNIDVVVVNNSRTSIEAMVASRPVRVRVVSPQENLGFAASNNAGVRASSTPLVAFLNDDTRADPAWLSAGVDTMRRRRAVAVASYVLDWEGRQVDFAGGSVNFEGKGFQAYVNRMREEIPADERPVLFANGAAMIVDRQVLLDAGGWDEETFAYYEDVELGWRLWLFGHEVWFAPESIVRHRHHGTSGRWPEPPRVRLLERNSLRAIYALLEDETLARALPAALLLAADRAFLQSALHRGADGSTSQAAALARPGFSERVRAALRAHGARRGMPLAVNLSRAGLSGLLEATRDGLFGGLLPAPAPVVRNMFLIEHGRQDGRLDSRLDALPADAAARLLGIQDFLRDLPALSARRQAIQRRRVLSDADIVARFGDTWLSPVPAANQALHDALHATLVNGLGLSRSAPLKAQGEVGTGEEVGAGE